MSYIVSEDIAKTKVIAAKFLRGLRTFSRARVVGLKGELGSGKTAFVKCVAELLGVRESVTSPTFVIMKIYKIKRPRAVRQKLDFECLIHIDAYRLGDSDELKRLGWRELAMDPKNLIFIEWPERVKKLLNKKTSIIRFEFIDEKKRKIEVDES